MPFHFKYPVNDWWTELGGTGVEGKGCLICGSRHSVGFTPDNRHRRCWQHKNCSTQGCVAILRARVHNRRIPRAEWDVMRLNSYDRDAIIPYLDDDVLVAVTEQCLANCSPHDSPASTYDEAIQLYARELAARLKGRL